MQLLHIYMHDSHVKYSCVDTSNWHMITKVKSTGKWIQISSVTFHTCFLVYTRSKVYQGRSLWFRVFSILDSFYGFAGEADESKTKMVHFEINSMIRLNSGSYMRVFWIWTLGDSGSDEMTRLKAISCSLQ